MVKAVDDWRSKRKAERDKITFTRKWPFALGLGLVLGLLALIDKGTLAADQGLTSTCQVTVVDTELLPVRSEPDAAAQPTAKYNLKRGEQRGVTTTLQNGYRKLSDGNWALDRYLRPLPPPLDKCAPS
ncbi:MAG: hypothetical protein H0V92_03020 [Pseudonocardiales bacterium]|nr:hypothetical protein [Pseudonocardiales bacterium]